MATRKYSLFEVTTDPVTGRKSYTRISTSAYPKSTAVRIFQGSLLAFAFGQASKPRELRPVKD